MRLKFVVSGSLKNFTQNELKDFIESHGHELLDNMRSDVDFLVCNDESSRSEKVNYALSENIGIISESDLMEMLSKPLW